MSFSPFEAALIALAAVIIALEQGLIDAPNLSAWLPSWITSPRWRYAPAVFLVVAASAFGWRQFHPSAPIPQAIPAQKQKVVYVTKQVAVPDPKQAAEIDRLRHLLAIKGRAPKLAVAAPALHQQAAPVAPIVAAVKPEDQELLDSLRCEKTRKAKKDELDELIHLGNIAELFSGEKDSITPREYSEWVAKVDAYFRTHQYFGFDVSVFDNIHGNQWMKAPTGYDADSASLWREIEAKKGIIEDLKREQDYYRCDSGPN